MLSYGLSEEQIMIKELARKVSEEKIKPKSREWDEKEEFPWEAMKALAQSDLFAVCIPEAYGGMGGGLLDLCLAGVLRDAQNLIVILVVHTKHSSNLPRYFSLKRCKKYAKQ